MPSTSHESGDDGITRYEREAMIKGLNPELTDEQVREFREKTARGEDPGKQNDLPKGYKPGSISARLDGLGK